MAHTMDALYRGAKPRESMLGYSGMISLSFFMYLGLLMIKLIAVGSLIYYISPADIILCASGA